jgi:glycosyltransferase involved in cell wall biosynthesis
MRLLLLDQFSDLGGAQQSLVELLPAMRQQGWDALVALPGEGELFARIRELGCATERIACGPFRSGRKSLADVARFLWQGPALGRHIAGTAQRWQADLIYVNGPRLLPAMPAGWPVVFHAHSQLPPGASRDLAAFALRRIGAAVIANCEFVAAPWRDLLGPDRVSVVYNGVIGPRGEPVALPTPPHPVVACVGRIAPEKGQRQFLQAAEVIHRAVPAARFEIVGAPLFGDAQAARYDAAVRAAAARLPVEFRGWVDDIYHTLAGIDLLLVPSAAHEATTRVILEAYAAGVPVVALRSGGVPEVVEQGVTGWLADSVSELAQRAIDLIRHPPRRAAMSRAARAAWERRFTIERYRRDVLSALAQAAAAGTVPPHTPPEPPRPPESIHSRTA